MAGRKLVGCRMEAGRRPVGGRDEVTEVIGADRADSRLLSFASSEFGVSGRVPDSRSRWLRVIQPNVEVGTRDSLNE